MTIISRNCKPVQGTEVVTSRWTFSNQHEYKTTLASSRARGRRAGGLFGSCLASTQGCPAAVAQARAEARLGLGLGPLGAGG